MKEMINGPKKGGQEPTAVRHPVTGDMVVSNEEIKRVTLEYCAKNLENLNPDPEVEKDSILKEHLNNIRMKDVNDEGFEIEKDDFENVLRKFGTKTTHSYDFLLKAGPKFKEAIFKLCKSMVENEEFPTKFRKTILNMIWKQKGPSEILKNNRFIHTKEDFLPRTCEALVANKMKEDILSKSRKYQIGGQPGHSPEEHIFSIKSVWQMFEMMGKGLIITLVDIVSFFDKENIYDVMQTLNDIGVNKKAARVWFKLNEGTEIAVKTAAGMSNTVKVGDCIGQGTAGAALVSQVNLDQGLRQYFGDGGEDLEYGDVQISPLAYQDDIMKGNRDVVGAQAGNIKLAAMLTDKGLEAHPDKTCFIVCGSKMFKEKADNDLKSNPLMFGNFQVKQKVCDKYLGQMLHSGGVEASATATVQERMDWIKGATMEVRSIVEDFQMQAFGGLTAAWELWERALLPSLLSCSGTWIGECKEAIGLCDQVQNFYWRIILRVPESCPKVALRCETQMLGMKWRVWQEKVMIFIAIQEQEEDGLAKEMMDQQLKMGFPGLGQEVRIICQEVGLLELEQTRYRGNFVDIGLSCSLPHFRQRRYT